MVFLRKYFNLAFLYEINKYKFCINKYFFDNFHDVYYIVSIKCIVKCLQYTNKNGKSFTKAKRLLEKSSYKYACYVAGGIEHGFFNYKM